MNIDLLLCILGMALVTLIPRVMPVTLLAGLIIITFQNGFVRKGKHIISSCIAMVSMPVTYGC